LERTDIRLATALVKEFIMGINIFWSSTRKFERRDCISFVVGGGIKEGIWLAWRGCGCRVC
jgi:hypothetical protein